MSFSRRTLIAAVFTASICVVVPILHAAKPTTLPLQLDVGEKVPSEDAQIKNLHGMGLIDGRTDVFRSASPVHELGLSSAATRPDSDDRAIARQRMHHLHDLGIRTIVCLEDANEPQATPGKHDALVRRLAIERDAAADAGIAVQIFPMRNKGAGSIETASDDQLRQQLDAVEQLILNDAAHGGVLFHCSAGHDRTGIVAAWIRIDHQHWSADAAIAEMRRLGHEWVKMSADGGVTSWHEDHLRTMTAATTRPTS